MKLNPVWRFANEHNKPTTAEEIAKDLVSWIISLLSNVAHWHSAVFYTAMTLCTLLETFQRFFKLRSVYFWWTY